MSKGSQAVFLSYTREDVAAAARLAEALREAGVEVWFDQDELRGGETWDAAIKQQIRTCALFLPVISERTEARTEGYFRREWRLAVDRSHDMAHTVRFFMPVVIDATPEAGAQVPEEFMRAHWTRLPRGLPTPEFVHQVQALLGEAAVVSPEISRRATTPAAKKLRGLWLALGVAAAAAIVVGFLWTRKSPASAEGVAATSRVNDKSIAVLPFTNMSDDQGNAFFADGVHEDLLTNLANIAELRVVSRTSVMPYRASAKTVRDIGRELGVAYILEGSVRRAGDTVRVVCQLIDARTDQHVWAPEPYDRKLDNIFSIQTELAQTIAAKLKAALTPQDKVRLERVPTTSTAAYDLYLRARAIANAGNLTFDTATRALGLVESAVELDPNFASAWGAIASYRTALARRVNDPTRIHALKAREAIQTMERLAPNDPNTWIELSIFYLSQSDFDRAENYLKRAAEAQPNNGFVVLLLADTDKRNGRALEAMEHYRRAYALDPQHPAVRRNYGEWLLAVRHFDDFERLERQNPRSDGLELAMLPFLIRGSTAEFYAWIAAHPNVDPELVVDRFFLMGAAEDYLKWQDEIRRRRQNAPLKLSEKSSYIAALLAVGQNERAHALALELPGEMRAVGADSGPGYAAALASAGDKAGALAALAAWQEADRKAGLKRDFLGSGWAPAFILQQAGEKEKAIAEFGRLLQVPSGLNVYVVRHSWVCRSLLGDPAFEALLADPKNNAPLL